MKGLFIAALLLITPAPALADMAGIRCDDIAYSAADFESAHQRGISKTSMDLFVSSSYEDDLPGMAVMIDIVDWIWARPVAAKNDRSQLDAEYEAARYWRHQCERQ